MSGCTRQWPTSPPRWSGPTSEGDGHGPSCLLARQQEPARTRSDKLATSVVSKAAAAWPDGRDIETVKQGDQVGRWPLGNQDRLCLRRRGHEPLVVQKLADSHSE